MFRHVSSDGSDAGSDDSISLTSTVFSEDDPDNTYIVENILAERWFPEEERTKYLVKWEGYPIERASWEPIEMFDDKNTINEWKAIKQRYENGNSPPEFDWQQWDAAREREAYEQHIRKVRRLKKRQKLQRMTSKPASSRGSRASSAKAKNFVVSEDEIVISPEEESESDVQKPKRKKRRKAEGDIEIEDEEDSGNTSVDSLMETLAKKAKRRGEKPKRETKAPEPKKQKTKTRGGRVMEEEGEAEEGEDWYSEDQGANKKPLNVTQNGRSTQPTRKYSANNNTDLERGITATASKLSRMDVQQRKSFIVPINHGVVSKAPGTIPKSGPRRRQPDSSLKASDPALLPGVPKVGKFISLSQKNRVYKRGRNEPAPDINALELFHAGEPKLSTILTRRGSGLAQHIEPRSLPDDAQRPKEAGRPPESGNLGIQEREEQRGPKRRKTDEGKTLSLEKYHAKRRDSAQKASEHSLEPSRPEFEDQMGLGVGDHDMNIIFHEDASSATGGTSAVNNDPWGLKKPPTGPAGWQANKMVTDSPEPLGILEPSIKPIFECELEMGPVNNIEPMGAVTFTGFTSSFTNFVEGLKVDRLWVSRFLEDAYISNFLVPEMGIPPEFADMDVDPDKSHPFISALVVLHGAGVILHEDFTLLIFQPSNDKLRQAFRTPMQQQRTPLRAVAYPPFDVPIPTGELPYEASMQKVFKEQPMNGFYVHTILERMLGVNCLEILQSSKGSDNIIIYCPEIAQAEHYEMEHALRVLKRECWPVNEIPGRMEKYEKYGSKVKLCVLVHFSLRHQLHLLPHIKHLKTRDHAFYFFGARLERTDDSGTIGTHPVRFWNFGTLIFLTPQFVMENEKATREVLGYQRAKAASTTICYSGAMLAQAEAYLAKSPEKAEAALKNVYALIDKKKRGEAVELQVQDADGCDELEIIADAFALHQLEHCAEYRRFMIGHSKDEDTSTAKAGLYDCIEFHDPESLVGELMLRAPGKPPSKKRPSESAPSA